MSCGVRALSNAKSWFLSRVACLGWMPAFDPVLKKRSIPLCRKLLINHV